MDDCFFVSIDFLTGALKCQYAESGITPAFSNNELSRRIFEHRFLSSQEFDAVRSRVCEEEIRGLPLTRVLRPRWQRQQTPPPRIQQSRPSSTDLPKSATLFFRAPPVLADARCPLLAIADIPLDPPR